ncbi:hypothetical protein ACFSSG_09230 [Euzebyella marina]|nr:hypothetical protein [Euzebyella marina]MBG48733.1 hypothetical protein [Pseudozobellia sp.]|tara:strand:- start:1694 stop:2200 length:507 start_codon:yes stop_codon:yes gene_type:complete
MMKNIIKHISSALAMLLILASCDQERLEPVLTAADGGGKMTSYTAYSIGTESETDVYGRVVFWMDAAGRTQVQVSVYNTEVGSTYPVSLISGTSAAAGSELMALYDLIGKESNGLVFGELGESKFYTITDTSFYDALPELDAHISIFSSGAIIASGDVGANAEPVEMN